MVRSHQLLVGIEKDADLSVAPRDPDGEDGRLEPGAQVEVERLLLVLLPDQEADVVAALNARDLFALYKGKHKIG